MRGGRAEATRAEGRRVMQDAMQDVMAAAREACSAEAYASGNSTLTPDEVLRATCDVEANLRDPFGDGDQSFLEIVSIVDRRNARVDPEKQALKNLWCDAGDFFGAFSAAIRACGYKKGLGITREPETGLSPFMLACALGDAMRVRAALAAAHEAGEEATFRLLERRETNLRVPPLHAVVIGANNKMTTEAGVKNQCPWSHNADHVQVARQLLDAGARPDAKDVCGYTMFHRCTSAPQQTWEITLEIGKLLLDARVDPNALNRFGDPPLGEVAMGNKIACALLLLEAGANPMQGNHFERSMTPDALVRQMPGHYDLAAAFSHAITRKCVNGTQRLQGRPVVLHGLNKAELNGIRGVCGRLFPLKQRYAVTVRLVGCSEQELLVQIKNLRAVRGLEGQRVVLVGLSREELNGREGVCGMLDDVRGRYAVRLDGDSADVNVKPQNLEAAGSQVTCLQCGKTAVRMDKCGKCFKVHFCGAACVAAGWAAHAESCKASRAGQIKLDPRTCGPPHWSVYDVPAGRERTTIVKVQVPLPRFLEGLEEDQSSILVYNCKHDLDFFVGKGTCPQSYAALRAVVCSPAKNAHEQLLGRKAYLSAKCHSDGTVTIDCQDPLPPQNW